MTPTPFQSALSSPDLSLEMDATQLRELVNTVLDHLQPHIDQLPDRPAWESPDDVSIAAITAGPLPESGNTWSTTLDELFSQRLSPSYNPASPGYLGYIPGGGLLHAAIADLIADVLNRYTTVWVAGPGLVQLETDVIRWFSDLMGMGPEAGGFLTTGGSLANWSAVVTARCCRLPEDFLQGTIYTSKQSHHSVLRAAHLAGFPACRVRSIGTDSDCRMDLAQLEQAIIDDRRNGLTPFLLVGQGGSTNTGAVDPLEALADIAQREQLWFHVDAAYGGFFQLTERGRQQLAGIERADSITLDPHKGLFLPYGTGCLLVRSRQTLHAAHGMHADYLPPMQENDGRIDYCQVSPELSRDFRSLRVWLPLKIHGFDTFKNYLDEKLDLVQWTAQQLENIPNLKIITQPSLSILTFRLQPPGVTDQAINELNQQLLTEINRSGEVFLTATDLDGCFTIRICVLCFRTHLDRLEACVQRIRDACQALAPAAS
jgi:aromatic-L-amino-acid decarboxylase